MAKAFEDHWKGALTGLVVTRYGYEVPCERIEIVQAAHPVPDAASLAASGRLLEFVRGLTADDLVLEGDGQKVLVDSVSLPFLTNATIDFSEELIGARFVINNPNATSSCGCGTSFSV